MNESIKSILSDEIISKIETAEQQNKDNHDAIYTLYIHIVPKEISGYEWDKYYVGITKQNPQKRWGSNGCGYKNVYFSNAIKKYGWKNIKHIVITNKLLKLEAESLEICTIAYLKSNFRTNGYNISKGGEVAGGSRKGNIGQYDLDGNLITIYSDFITASRAINVDRSVIYGCVTGLYLTVKGYMWRYVDENPVQKIEPYHCPPKHNEKNVLQYDLDGNFIKEWANLNEASRYYNIEIRPYRTIVTGAYMWKYKNGDSIPQKITPYKDYGLKKVYVYDIEGNYIDVFLDIFDAKAKLGLSLIDKKVLNRSIDNNYCEGYRFTCDYYDFLPPLVKSRNYISPIPVAQINEDGKFINIFRSVKNAADETGICIKSISRVCQKILKKGVAGGYKWKYLKDIDESELTDSFLLEKYHELMKKEVCDNDN